MQDKDRLILSLFAALAYARDAGSFSDSDRLFIDCELICAYSEMQRLGALRGGFDARNMGEDERQRYILQTMAKDMNGVG